MKTLTVISSLLLTAGLPSPPILHLALGLAQRPTATRHYKAALHRQVTVVIPQIIHFLHRFPTIRLVPLDWRRLEKSRVPIGLLVGL